MHSKPIVILVTSSQGKLNETVEVMKHGFGDNLITFKTSSEVGFTDEIIEDGDTFESNAFLKAQTVHEWTKTQDGLQNAWVISDDSGLTTKALNGAPGVYSARYSGGHGNHAANNDLLLKNMEGAEDRSAAMVTCIGLYSPSGEVTLFTESLDGTLLTSPKGDNGFGYDPLFLPNGYNKTYAEFTLKEKCEVSHRTKALTSALKEILLSDYSEKFSDLFNSKESVLVTLKDGRKIWHSRSVAVASIIFVDDENTIKILMIKRGPLSETDAGKWAFPAGFLNWNETLSEAAIRELYEETGLYAPDLETFSGSSLDTGRIVYSDSRPLKDTENVLLAYTMFTSAKELPKFSVDFTKNKGEIADIRLISIDDLENYDITQQVRDVIREVILTETESIS
jgi:XTP/dITP diphosphohydrolase